ncbi:efflux RND transporter periplasmic adaptor subunit [Listeria costaricensis]|uniref:efflux RND transporter periplasmic adaptor subunit n=1 Tax=Listeria costaricensis TaxID=2026604 RepID=UPI000C082AB5|nr:HlyD family secretion protein [Listeria costaricensis]
MKKIAIGLLCLVVISGLFFLYISWQNQQETQETKPSYETTKVMKEDLKVFIYAKGQIIQGENSWPDYKEYAAEVLVDELDITKVKKDQTVDIHVTALPDKTLTGKITSIDQNGIISGDVTQYKVSVMLDDESQLMANMHVTADILVDEQKDALTLLKQAVHTDDQKKKFVYLPTKNGKVRVFVETGAYNDKKIQITSGLKENETVIVADKK